MFQRGDYVHLIRGTKKMVITYVNSTGDLVRAIYVSKMSYYGYTRNRVIRGDARFSGKRRPAADFSYYGTERLRPDLLSTDYSDVEARVMTNIDKEKTMTAPQLYQTKEEPVRYGLFMAHNPKGEIVLEMKGDKTEYEAFAPDAIEEVMPWTFDTRSVTGDRSHHCHYAADENSVSVGDMLLSDTGNIYRVIATNTKHKTPKKEFVGVRIKTEPLTV